MREAFFCGILQTSNCIFSIFRSSDISIMQKMHITFFLVKWSNSQTFFIDTILNFLLINLAEWEFFTTFAQYIIKKSKICLYNNVEYCN